MEIKRFPFKSFLVFKHSADVSLLKVKVFYLRTVKTAEKVWGQEF